MTAIGGAVVFDVGKRLEALGHAVQIIILDTEFAGVTLSDSAELELMNQSVAEKLLSVVDELLGASSDKVKTSHDDPADELKRRMLEAGYITTIDQTSLIDGALQVYEAQEALFMKYQAKGRLKGEIVWLYSASSFAGEQCRAAFKGLQSLSSQRLLAREVEGTHVSMLRHEHVGSIVKAIKPLLTRVTSASVATEELALE